MGSEGCSAKGCINKSYRTFFKSLFLRELTDNYIVMEIGQREHPILYKMYGEAPRQR